MALFNQRCGSHFPEWVALTRQNIQKRRTFVLAIDESQYLNAGIFRDIKMLMNVYFDSLDCFALIFIGQPYLVSILEKPVHESLKQRIVIHYSYEGLASAEAKDYIYSRLEAAGGARTIIDDAAVHAVANSCQGTPRLINSLMTNALILGVQLQKTVIDTEVVLAAGNNLALR